MPYIPENWATRNTVDAALMAKIEAGVRDSHAHLGVVALDSYPTSVPGDPSYTGDDARLKNAMVHLGADTYKRVIRPTAREHTFTRGIGKPFDHFAICAPPNSMTFDELGVSLTTKFNINVPGPWIDISSGTSRGIAVDYIASTSNRSDTVFIRTAPSAVLWGFTGDTLQFRGFYGVLGTAAEKCRTNFCVTKGPWQVNGFHNTPFNIGGSDSLWWCGASSLNIGSGGLGPGAGGSGDQAYMMIFADCANTNVGPIYLSCNNHWRGILVTGSRINNRGLFFHGIRTEGQTGTAASDGTVLQINGGAVGFSQIVVAQGMTDPAATTAKNSWGAPDGGLIGVRGSDTQVSIDQMCVWHAVDAQTVGGAVDSAVPILHVTKSTSPAAPLPVSPRVRLTNVLMGGKQGTPPWTTLPVAQQTGAGCITGDEDGSYTITTAA
ncbi:hypothetical protein [Nocardioides speluncae]|uniref:hypothetical protein n=1 Tax=Nocardioides speluncae TaxID=2670337 RepID=UPI000D693D04|nr:hypothetical protein [Nocardioides speluncae]